MKANPHSLSYTLRNEFGDNIPMKELEGDNILNSRKQRDYQIYRSYIGQFCSK